MSERPHPGRGELRAFLDRDLAPRDRFRVRIHLARCPRCRKRLDVIRNEGERVSALLRDLTPTVDPVEAWGRLVVRSAGRARRRQRILLPLASLLPAAMTASIFLTRQASGPLDEMDPRRWLREAENAGDDEVVRDICCADHDGGGLFDDGLFTLSRPDEDVRFVVVYEDVDGSGTLTPGDILRHVSSRPKR